MVRTVWYQIVPSRRGRKLVFQIRMARLISMEGVICADALRAVQKLNSGHQHEITSKKRDPVSEVTGSQNTHA